MSARLLAALVLGCCSSALAQEAGQDDTQQLEKPSIPDDSGKRPDFEATARRVVDETNAFRKQEGRPPVAVEPKLKETAQAFAEYMAKHDKYGHKADGKRPDERAKAHGYEYCLVLENIAHAYDSRGFEAGPLADVYMKGWKESPGHRRNMLDPDVTETGVAVARSETTGRYYAVQLFGRPRSAAIGFSVANKAEAAVRYKVDGQPFDLPPRMIRTHTVCRPATVTFEWPDGKTETVKPPAGAQFAVEKIDAGFILRQERAAAANPSDGKGTAGGTSRRSGGGC